MYLLNIGWAIFFLTSSNGNKKKRKRGKKSGNLYARSARCSTCSYNVYWIHHKANQLAARWRCTDINSGKNRGGTNHRIPKGFGHWVTDLRLWAGKNFGFAYSLGFVASKSWSCWARFRCLRGDAAPQGYPAALRRDTCRRGRDCFQARHSQFAQTLLLRVQGPGSRTAPASAAPKSVGALPSALRVPGQYPIVCNTYGLVIDFVHAPEHF